MQLCTKLRETERTVSVFMPHKTQRAALIGGSIAYALSFL